MVYYYISGLNCVVDVLFEATYMTVDPYMR